MDANALYYTLSTIAQTLAGAVAVLVAVVLFNLTRVDDSLNSGRSTFQSDADWKLVRERGPKALGDKLRAADRRVAERAYRAWHVRPRLRRALGLTVADISLCFVTLPFSRPLSCSYAAGVVVFVAVFLGIVCLGLYWQLLASLMNPQPD